VQELSPLTHPISSSSRPPSPLSSLRYRSSKQCSTSTAAASSTPASPPVASASLPPATPQPMLATAGPGWVCYAEKTHGDCIIPLLSSCKSPQAVMGSLVKRVLGRALLGPGLGEGEEEERGRLGRLYHATVMPCYDKKLEASREELTVKGGLPEVRWMHKRGGEEGEKRKGCLQEDR
jgi:iron only hydrogenase large subunit-like protein